MKNRFFTENQTMSQGKIEFLVEIKENAKLLHNLYNLLMIVIDIDFKIMVLGRREGGRRIIILQRPITHSKSLS